MIEFCLIYQLVAIYSGFLNDLLTVEALNFPATMLTRGMTFIRDPGMTLELDCMFAYDEYNIFRNPIVWKKRQMNETVSINLNKNIYPPFLDTRRFEISLNVATTTSTTTAVGFGLVRATPGSVGTTTRKWMSDGRPASSTGSHNRRAVVHEQLRLSNVTIEDTGDYICEVKGSQSVVMTTVTHHVIVRAPVQKLHLFTDSAPSNNPMYNYKQVRVEFHDKINTWSFGSKNRLQHSANGEVHSRLDRKSHIPEVIIVQGQPRGLGCTAVGGSPAPEVKLFVGSKEITDFFAVQQTISLISSSISEFDYDGDDANADGGDAMLRNEWMKEANRINSTWTNNVLSNAVKYGSRRSIGWSQEVKRLPKGLQMLRWNTRRWSNTGGGLHLRDEHLDSQVIRCTASVSGLKLPVEREAVVVARITMHYAPKITCQTTSAYTGERHVTLRCEVRSKPDLIALFWTIGTSGTVVSPNKEADEFWSVNRVKNDTLVETTLHIRQISESHFRTYSIVAENNVATTTTEVQVTKREHHGKTAAPKSSPSSANHVAASVRRYDALANQNDRDIYRFSVMTSMGLKIDVWKFQSIPFYFAILQISMLGT